MHNGRPERHQNGGGWIGGTDQRRGEGWLERLFTASEHERHGGRQEQSHD
ncbi:hypothetical protein RB2654_09579 [Rhodobacterales bacterium HTCC2654]|uniref:Uncharacterized protein n=1 Tax=Maritimibacter alkaliphilus HTCC2654 TaxID=314271 RepID=A3VEH2_9RHOB|nr:hypothetical protein RB2654_09579 [Rhodobacterales bacterium HTCC2654] [Maritimibacter alkaliphilus HTCC2654]